MLKRTFERMREFLKALIPLRDTRNGQNTEEKSKVFTMKQTKQDRENDMLKLKLLKKIKTFADYIEVLEEENIKLRHWHCLFLGVEEKEKERDTKWIEFCNKLGIRPETKGDINEIERKRD